jgi:hypothetical protein
VTDNEHSETQSWDAFWAEVDGDRTARTETIRGVTVRVPTDLQLRFGQRLEELQDSEREEDVASLVADLFGHDVYGQWAQAGMTGREFQTVLAWGISHARGQAISFHEAYALVKQAEQGKPAAPIGGNREQRRQSARTGGPSRPTSGASTHSRRRR